MIFPARNPVYSGFSMAMSVITGGYLNGGFLSFRYGDGLRRVELAYDFPTDVGG